MGRYLEGINKTKPIKSRISFFRNYSDEEVPEMSSNQIHVEYENPSFFRKVITWRRRVKLNEAEVDMDEAEKVDAEELESEIEALEAEEGHLEEMEDDVEERKQGLMSRLFSKMGISKSDTYAEDFDSEEYETPPPELDEDVKEVLKITHSWIEKLGPRHKKAFKDSDDFVQYKEILLKYGLVREK